MAKCIYCGKDCERRNKFEVTLPATKKNGSIVNETAYCCCDEHTDKARVYVGIYNKWHNAILLLQIVLLVLILAFAVWVKDTFLAAVFMTAFGLTLAILPMASPTTIVRQGIKKSRIISRILGVAMIACGIVAFFAK